MCIQHTSLKLTLIALIAALAIPAARSAETAETLLQSLQQAKIFDNKDSVSLYILSDEVLLSIGSESALTPDVFKHAAVDSSKIIYTDPALKSKKFRIVMSSRGTNLASEITMNDGQGEDAITIAAVQRSSNASPVLIGTTSGIGGAAGGAFRSERAKLSARLQVLEKKGVGIKLYKAELLKADEEFNASESGKATEALAKLTKEVEEQEAHFKIVAAPTNPIQSARLVMTGSKPAAAAVAPPQRSSAAEYAARMGMKSNGLGDFTGSSDAYYDEVARQMLAHELGDLAPIEGAFRLERFRLAKKIQELKSQGVKVDNYRIYFRKIEDLAASKDPRKISELRDSIQYLQKQLGLSQLQGGTH